MRSPTTIPYAATQIDARPWLITSGMNMWLGRLSASAQTEASPFGVNLLKREWTRV